MTDPNIPDQASGLQSTGFEAAEIDVVEFDAIGPLATMLRAVGIDPVRVTGLPATELRSGTP